MRQAGRSLPEYRAARGPGSILDAIAQPELVAELTRQPVDRYGTDAAIFFSDIVVPVAAIGFGVDVAPGTGPVVAEPFRSQGRPPTPPAPRARDRHPLRHRGGAASWPSSWRCRSSASPAGPFTVASYLVEGGPVQELRPGQGPHARRTGRLARTGRAARPTWPWPRCGPSWTPGPRPSRSSTAGPASSPPATTRSWCCRPPPALRRAGRVPPRGAHHPVRRGHRRAAGVDGHGRELGGGHRLAGAARRGPAAGGTGRGRPGQPRPGHVPDHLGGGRGRDPRGPGPGRRRPRATSSTWATASSPRPTRPSSSRWPSWSTPRDGPGWRTAR